MFRQESNISPLKLQQAFNCCRPSHFVLAVLWCNKKAAADGELERVKETGSNSLHVSLNRGESVWE